MDARLPEEDAATERYGLVLKEQTYQAVFEYSVEERRDSGLPFTPDVSANEKVFFRVLPFKSISPIIICALAVAFLSLGVWQGWLPSLAVSQISAFRNDEIWRFFTAQFQHGDAKHLLNNLLPFVGIGWLLWGYFGILAFPVVPVIAGTLANFVAVLTYEPRVQLVGISGTVFAMAGMWCALYIKNDNRYSVNKRILRAMGFLMILFFPFSLEQNVADRVHVLGGLIGLLCGYLGWGRLLPQRISAQRSSAGKVRVL